MTDRHTQNGSSHEQDRFPDELLTAYALGQLEDAERGEFERMLASPAQVAARQQVAEIQRLAGDLPTALNEDVDPPQVSPALREAVVAALEQPKIEVAGRRRWLGLTWIEWSVAGGLACLVASLVLPQMQSPRKLVGQIASSFRSVEAVSTSESKIRREIQSVQPHATSTVKGKVDGYRYQDIPLTTLTEPAATDPTSAQPWFGNELQRQTERLDSDVATITAAPAGEASAAVPLTAGANQDSGVKAHSISGGGIPGHDPSRHDASQPGNGQPGGVGGPGNPTQFSVQGQPGPDQYRTPRLTQNNGQSTYQNFYEGQQGIPKNGATVKLQTTPRIIVQEVEESQPSLATIVPQTKGKEGEPRELEKLVRGQQGQGGEQYDRIYENTFLAPRQNPLSTFSIDVDTASYANMRRFLTGGSLPPADAVRIEELVNYFRYDYPQPKGPEPFSVNMEVAECPWAQSHLLLRVGLKGQEVHRGERPASNLVFLLDVSGSMADENKLPLLKTAMQMFAAELGENDRVSIVTYAGEAGLRLPPTRGHEYEKIRTAIESLSSGGSTNGSAGIELAYEQAKAYFVEGGTNRVILCTDGDLNVGVTDDESLVQLIKQKAGGGTFLTVLGFGEGNLKDAKMEKLADNGNGLYAYIDSVREARKVLVEQMTGSTITIAKDVKIQIEFNPALIASYRLLGYENRVLAAQDFNDDKKDAGEIGAGHTVTALYELVPVGAKPDAAAPQPAGEPLKYQSERISQIVVGEVPQAGTRELTDAAKSGELLTLMLRYKEPEGQVSKLLEVPLKERGGKFNAASKDLQFAAAVASFGMLLRGSEHKGSSNVAAVEEIASGAIGEDAGGYRAEFVDLVRKAHSLGAR